MSKVLLVDFDESDKKHLSDQKYDADLVSGGATEETGGLVASLGGSEAVFILLTSQSGRGSAVYPSGSREALDAVMTGGGLVALFLDQTDPVRLASVIGGPAPLTLEEVPRPEGIIFSPRALFHVPFERYRPYLRKAFKILAGPLPEGEWKVQPAGGPSLDVFAKSPDGFPVSVLMRVGKGALWLLPSFGPKNIEIVGFMLKNRSFMESLSEGEIRPQWLDDEEYSFPEVKALSERKDEEVRRHALAMAELDGLIVEEKKRSQECFLNLLSAEGQEFKRAVLETLRYLGWARAIDVNDYWKKVIRGREEDIWLMDASDRPLEAGLRMEELIMIVIRSDKNWAGDDDCALIQKFKGRRMQEFGNTRMKAILVGNYFSASEPKQRRSPFSAVQIEEAVKDGNGLMSTWELFKAVKAEKEGRLTKGFIREAIGTRNGLIEFSPDLG